MENKDNILWIIIRKMRTPLIVIIVTFAISILGMVLIPGQDSNGNVYHMNFFDALYFVTYMASTIGFGEIPYEFTYAQRMWVLFSIFISVIGWFYAIGALVALIQDKNLIAQIALARFQRKIKQLKEPFIIILGYNHITKNLIKQLSLSNKRIVIIDKEQEKIEEIELENFIPEVYALKADVNSPDTLRLAGIKKRNCKGVVALFDNDFKNTKIALLAKLLNDRINVIVKSTTKEQSEHLKNLQIKTVIDPFSIISSRFYLALTSPSLWILEMMFFGHELKLDKFEYMPKGKYVICGYGRMGKAIAQALTRAKLEYTYIDLKSSDYKKNKKSAIFGDSNDFKDLVKAGVKEAAAIVAATKDDLINLTIILTAKKINPNIYTIARENTIEDITIFKSAKVDRLYVLENLISDYVHKVIHLPLAYYFINEIHKQSEEWGEKILAEIKTKVQFHKPEIFQIKVSKTETFALYNYLKENKENKILLGQILRDLRDYTKRAKVCVLMVKNRKEEITFMPDDNYEVKVSDTFLIAATHEAREDLELALNNYNEFYYILTGKEPKYGIFKLLEQNKEKKAND